MIDPPDLSPGSSSWDTNRTNRTWSSGGKYESAPFPRPALHIFVDVLLITDLRLRSKFKLY